MLVAEALRSDQENICFVDLEALFHVRPLDPVRRGFLEGMHSHSLGGRNLVPHERKQGGNEQCGPRATFSQQLGGDEVNEALAPSGFLNDEESSVPLHDVANSILLPVSER